MVRFVLEKVEIELYNSKIRRYETADCGFEKIVFLNEDSLKNYCENVLFAKGKVRKSNNVLTFPNSCRCSFLETLKEINLPPCTDKKPKIVNFSTTHS